METIKAKAAAMLQKCETVILTSVNKEGYPRPVPMSKIKSEDFFIVWVATGSNSLKTKDFSSNPKAGLCYQEGSNSVALTGDVEIIKDNAIKKELWQDWFIEHFPGGSDDPNYTILKFKGNHATFWIDGKFIHRKV